MKRTYFTVGPTELYPEIKKYALMATKDKIFSVSHRSKEFTVIHLQTCLELKKLLGIPKNYYIFFTGSATESMERIIQNLVCKKSFHFVNGFFAERFYNVATQLKKTPLFVKADYGCGFDFNKIDIPKDSELICLTQNETSTGVAIDMQNIYNIKRKYPEKIIALDIVSSVPYAKIDFSKIDVAFFSIQKGFGMPPGMGVIVIKKECIEKTKMMNDKGYNIGAYFNFIAQAQNAEKHQTVVTPNLAGIYILGKICRLLNERGIDNIREETEFKAELLYRFFDEHRFVKPFVKDTELRSKTTLVFESVIESDAIIKRLNNKGYVISSGYGDYKNKHIRIGNFPMHKLDDVGKLLHTLNNL